jgi:hypothetical protein
MKFQHCSSILPSGWLGEASITEKIKMRNSKQERHQMKDKEDIETTLVIN